MCRWAPSCRFLQCLWSFDNWDTFHVLQSSMANFSTFPALWSWSLNYLSAFFAPTLLKWPIQVTLTGPQRPRFLTPSFACPLFTRWSRKDLDKGSMELELSQRQLHRFREQGLSSFLNFQIFAKNLFLLLSFVPPHGFCLFSLWTSKVKSQTGDFKAESDLQICF